MARTSIPWSLLPAKELGCGSATTCWRRFDEWAKAGVFDQLQTLLLDELARPAASTLDESASTASVCGRSEGGHDRR